MEVPCTDARSYEHLILSKNGLRCLLIEDVKADKSAAAMAVGVGQMQDGALPGLAHLTGPSFCCLLFRCFVVSCGCDSPEMHSNSLIYLFFTFDCLYALGLEHLLFMGTTKFPDENGFDKYLSAAGGHSVRPRVHGDGYYCGRGKGLRSSVSQRLSLTRSRLSLAQKQNAYTNLETTVYYCDCQQGGPALDGALDRFASFFVCPLLAEGSVKREIQAVDSEHAKNVTSDHWRLDYLSRTMLGRMIQPNNKEASDVLKEQHPYASFGSGNRESLEAHDVASLSRAVREFWQTYYRAGNMTLAVLGNNMADLKRMVELYFSDVPGDDDDDSTMSSSRPAPLPALSPPLPLRVDVVPIREHITVELQWPMREIQTLYRSKPSRFVSHLLGHEGPGSLLACLRERHWAQELGADDVSKSCRNFSVFSLELELTQAGLENLHQVIALVFRYIELLRDIPQWVHDELKAASDMQFRFLSDRPPSDTVSTLVDSMQQYPPHLVLAGPYKLFVDQHPKDDINEIVQYLTPANVLVIVAAQGVETDQVDRWYGTCYKEVPIDEAVLELWKSPPADAAALLRLPDQNDMLPTSFDLVAPGEPFASDPLPRCLVDTPTCRLWYKPDTAFSQPKVNILILLRTTAAYMESPLASVLSTLWVECLQEHAKDFSYAASMAGLHCDFAPSRAGLELDVSGYSHKASILVERIVSAIDTLPNFLTSDVLERIVEKTRNQFSAFLVAQPYQHAIYATDLCLEDRKWPMQDRMVALDDVTLDDLLHFSSHILQRLNVELLVHGNVTGAEARNISKLLVERWAPQPPLQLPVQRVVNLESSCSVYKFRGWNEHDTNSCVVNVYQIGPVSTRSNAILSVVQHLLREPAFNQLRTEEQLGYIVHTAIKTNGDNIKSWICLVQSDSFDPLHVDLRIEAFLDGFRSTLAAMSEEEFASNVDSVCQNLLEKNKNLGEESSKHWSVISNQTYRFQRLQEIAAEARGLELNDVLRFFDRYLLAQSPFRRKLSVQVFGKNHQDSLETDASPSDGVALIRQPHEFRNGQPLYPLSQTVSIENRLLTIAEAK
jgi:insulysin